MINLTFKDREEFERLFTPNNGELVAQMSDTIREASEAKKNTAEIFLISFDNSDFSYEVTIAKKEWPVVLQQCLEYYHKNEMSDECIDVWQLLDKIKKELV